MTKSTNIIAFALETYKNRFKLAYGSYPNKVILNTLKGQLKDGLLKKESKRLIFEITKNGSIRYFIYTDIVFYGEHNKKFITFPLIYCANNQIARKKFYTAIDTRCKEAADLEKINEAAIWCHLDDKISNIHFQNSKLAVIELAGDVKQTLKILKIESTHLIRKFKKTDIKAAAALEYQAHLCDKTSRMHTITKNNKNKALKMYTGACENILKNANAFVSLHNKKITGFAAAYPNKKTNSANVATIAIHPNYQGLGISKSLYIHLLTSLAAIGIKKYTGHTTTKAVVNMAKQMGRTELSRVYTFQIK